MTYNYTKLKYTGTAPGANTDTSVLFSTVVAFPGKNYCQMAGLKRLIVDLKHSQAGEMHLSVSEDRGVTWDEIYDSGSIAAPAATSSTIRDFAIEPYADFKLEWENGGSAQATWLVRMALTDERAPLT